MLSIESLESRRLLSASPGYIVGQYTGVAAVAFSPAAGHAPASDALTVTVSGESAKGKLTGTIGDSFGQTAAIAGRITARGVAKLHIVTDRHGSDESGKLSLAFDPNTATLSGSYREVDRADHSPLRWHGQLSAQAPPDDFVGSYSGVADGKYSPQNLGPQITQTPYEANSALTIATESTTGAVTGSISGFGVSPTIGQEFTIQLTGTVSGNLLSLSAPPSTYQVGLSATLTAGTNLDGTFGIMPNDIESYVGTFSFAAES